MSNISQHADASSSGHCSYLLTFRGKDDPQSTLRQSQHISDCKNNHPRRSSSEKSIHV